MQRPPRESVLAHGLWQYALWVGLLMLIGALFPGVQAWALDGDGGEIANSHWQTCAWTAADLPNAATIGT